MKEEPLCKIAACTGTFHCWCSARLPRLKSVILHYLIALLFTTAVTLTYIEIGHDKGWPRAEVWYTCLYTHHHFPWQ